MAENTSDNVKIREVAAVFDTAERLDQGVDALTAAGFNRAGISVMGAYEAVRNRLDHVYEPVTDLEDDPRVPQQAFVGKSDRAIAETAVIGAPMYLLGMAGALGVVATGGAAALAMAAAAAGGAVGGGIGALISYAMEKTHATKVAKDLEAGGLLLWVAVASDEDEKRAITALENAGGSNVHGHEITRSWGAEDIQLSTFNPDPFLGRDPA